MSRRKGKTGELEACHVLQELIGFEVKRSPVSARDGGGDLENINLGGYGVEIKRCETLELRSWWSQTCRQARAAGTKPALMYRRSREPWRVLVALCDLLPTFSGTQADDLIYTTQMTPEAFATLVRERLTS